MKPVDTIPEEAADGPGSKPPKGKKHRMNCELIQSMLLDYLNRELDGVRSDLVWKHIKKCPDCEAEVREMESTLAVLRNASVDRAGVPSRLSEKQRARIVHALTHPVIHWMERNHVVASLALAALLVIGVAFYLKWLTKDAGKPTPIPPAFTVSLDPSRSPNEPEFVTTNSVQNETAAGTNTVTGAEE